MGKKVKTGKSRRDKYYQLAKETGYRARSAFKLLQLNRKYGFLQKSRVLVDLCAAPGGWLQVASHHMPVSSHIIGIDLVPIKPIHNVITLQEDITTEKCRQSLKKEMQTWKADVFLHDGAPNVGKNWLHDAFSQAQLTLQALKLSIEFLRKGGWFVTKVFRSKDYHALIWVFKQLFKKVYATKPQASRNESAEIFVVCQGFLAPDKIDAKFTDPRHVFKDVKETQKVELNLIHPEKQKRQTEGYADGDYTLYHVLDATTFITSQNHLELLANAGEIVIDNELLKKHKATTSEILECCRDIKVLGKKEIRSLLSWRKKMKEFMIKISEAEAKFQNDGEAEHSEDDSDEEDDTEGNEEEDIDQKIAELKAEEMKELKKKKKKVRKKKAKLQRQMDMKMILPGDKMDYSEDFEMFSLNKIKTKKNLAEIEKGDASFMDQENDSEPDDEDHRKHRMSYERNGDWDYGLSSDEEDDDDDPEMDDLGDDDDEEDEEGNSLESDGDEKDFNPLVVDLEDKDVKIDRKTAMWFQKDAFSGLSEDQDEDLEIETMMKVYKKKGGVIIDKDSKTKNSKQTSHAINDDLGKESGSDSESQDGEEDDDSIKDSDEKADDMPEKVEDDEVSASQSSDDHLSDYDENQLIPKKRQRKDKTTRNKDGFEVVPVNQTVKNIKLDPEGLAIGAAMVQSRKRRREVFDQSYNRYTFHDDHLPDWFTKDERKHCKKMLPVTKEEVNEYKQRLKEINARSVKKVAEAKARKKRKMMKKAEKARKKAEVVTDTVDVTDKEKWQQIKQIYKRAGLLKKKKAEVTYVVAKRGAGKRVSRPPGVKGRFKVVDPRMKKDTRASIPKNSKGRSKSRRKS